MNRIKKTRESGLYKQWIQDILNYNDKHISKLIREEKRPAISFCQLSLGNLYDLFYMLLFFYFISILLLVFEKSYSMLFTDYVKNRKIIKHAW